MKAKRALCVLLAFILIFGLAVPTMAASAKNVCACPNIPEIHVPGWAHEIYYKQGTPEERVVDFVNTENIASGLGLLLRGFGLAALRLNWDYAADGLGALLYTIFSFTRLDAEGNSLEPISNHWDVDPSQNHKKNTNYRFGYDWRMDPMDIARQLNDYIQAVKAQTGHSKVALFGESQGACAVMAYIAQFGTDDLDSLVLATGAQCGVEAVGQMLCGKLHVDSQGLVNFLGEMIADDTGIVRCLLQGLRTLRVLDALLWPIQDILLPKVQRRLFDNYLLEIFGYFPSLWSFLPDEYYEDAKAYLFHGREAEFKSLIAKADDYHYNVQAKHEQLLLDAQASGVRVALFVAYDKPAMPVTAHSNYQSDGLIDTPNESCGATVAPFGEVLALTQGKYLSPDRVIDASTCALPDTTWFIKGNGHDTKAMQELRHWFAQNKNALNIFSDARYPQFMRKADDRVVPQ